METEEDSETVLSMTARLTVAYLRGNPLAAADMAGLVETIYGALRLAEKPLEEPAVLNPAVPIKKSITAEAIICLECGKPQKMLKRHLAAAHGLSVTDYRTKWSLPSDYPMTAPDYAAHRSALALKFGLGKKTAEAPAADPAGSPETKTRGYRYPASRWSKSGQ